MKKCQNPDHPHCTQWVQPGASVCAAQHVQPPAQAFDDALQTSQAQLYQAKPTPKPGSEKSSQDDGIRPAVLAAAQAALQAPSALSKPLANNYANQATRAHLHVSGFDPRAAGGRQSIKLGLQGIIAPLGTQIQLLAKSELLSTTDAQQQRGFCANFVRTSNGEWQPMLLSFSSRGKEHGQYAIDIELRLSNQRLRRKWLCTLIILVPRADANLAEIHQTFLATHKNVRVQAEDGSIANLQGVLAGAGSISLDISAKNGGLAKVDLHAPDSPSRKPHDVGFASIAWDEDLLEVEHDELPMESVLPGKPQSACILTRSAGLVQHLRLFAMQECVLGRWQDASQQQELGAEEGANLMLAQFMATPNGAQVQLQGLTRRISARHAIIRFGAQGVTIEDISRFGLLLDGEWPGKHKVSVLHPGMKIHFSHSFHHIVELEVSALLPHLLLLQRSDAGRLVECFYLLKPNTRPDLRQLQSSANSSQKKHCMPSGFPLLFHADASFWHLDQQTGRETRLAASAKWPALADLAPASQLRDAVYVEEELRGQRDPDGAEELTAH